jgi:hypothetical protein
MTSSQLVDYSFFAIAEDKDLIKAKEKRARRRFRNLNHKTRGAYGRQG